MSTTTTNHHDPPTSEMPDEAQTSAPRLLASEWTKLWSVRSTWTALAVSVALGVLFSVAIAAGVNEGDWDGASADAIATVLSGTSLAGLGLGVLGALQVSGEYASGTITTSFAAEPRRWPVLLAKAAVLAGVVAPVAALMSVAGVSVASLVLDPGFGVSLTADGAWEAILGNAAYVTSLALLGAGIATVVRSTALSVTLLVALVFVLPSTLPLLPGAWVATVADHLPSALGEVLASSAPAANAAMSTASAAIGAAAWSLVPLGAGVLRVLRSDA